MNRSTMLSVFVLAAVAAVSFAVVTPMQGKESSLFLHSRLHRATRFMFSATAFSYIVCFVNLTLKSKFTAEYHWKEDIQRQVKTVRR